MTRNPNTESSKPGFGYFLYHYAWQAVDWVYPPICAGCEKPGTRWCDACSSKVKTISSPFCPQCGAPVVAGETCRECDEHPPLFDRLRSWAVFDGPVRSALHRLKYRRDLGLGEILAQPLVNIIQEEKWDFDMVLPIPLSKGHLRQRGYNQAQIIALPVALKLKKECISKGVMRIKDTSSQIALSPHERYINLQDAFYANPAKLKDRNILLIDDVATTGATLNSCAGALRDAGVKTIYCLTVAKALRKKNEASAGS